MPPMSKRPAPRKKGMAATIQQVAQHVGVSVQTVSAILGTKGHLYRSQTRERVFDAAKSLGYRPNVLAKATRTGRSGNIAFLISSDLTYAHCPAELLSGIETALSKNGLKMSVSQLPDDKLTDEGYVPNVLREWYADGMLINYHYHIPPRMVELVRSNELPSVWINSQQESDCVYPDEAGASASAVEYLAAKGFRRPAYVDFAHGIVLGEDHYSVADRRTGFIAGARKAGAKPKLFLYETKVPMGERVARAKQILSAADRPDGLVVYSRTSADPFYLAGCELGLKVGKDYQIVTFDDKQARLCSVYNVPTMLVPNLAMGHRAVELLVKKVANPQVSLKAEVIPFGQPQV
jgi:LacI family transcriptional regulator